MNIQPFFALTTDAVLDAQELNDRNMLEWMVYREHPSKLLKINA